MNKKEKLFCLNNILIAAFGTNSFVGKRLIKENVLNVMNVSGDILSEFNSIINGGKVEIAPITTPTEEEANEYFNNNQFSSAFLAYSKLLKNNPDNIDYINKICYYLVSINAFDVIKKFFFKTLLKYANINSNFAFIAAKTCVSDRNPSVVSYKRALNLLKPYIDSKNYDFNMAYEYANYYNKLYQDKNLDKQIDFMKVILKQNPNNNQAKLFLADLLQKNGENEQSFTLYKEVMGNNPNHDHKQSYAHFLINNGYLTEGYDLLRDRIYVGKVSYPVALTEKKRWDGKADLSNSTVIIHYEQGFGDNVLCARYIKDVAKLAKKTYFVVQDNLLPLFKASGYEEFCTLLSQASDIDSNMKLKLRKKGTMSVYGSGMLQVKHDYHIPIMDLPYLFKAAPENIAYKDGFIKTNPEKVEKFRNKFIKNNSKLKIGISYHGNDMTNYANRDIPFKKFLPLINMPHVEIYGFQADKYAKEMDKYIKEYKNVFNLGKRFKTFEDTACAIDCMDVIISTDNVIMNLAGALGKKTYGLFNVYPVFMWYKTEGDDIGWYSSVRPFKAKSFNGWDDLILEVKSQLEKDFPNKFS